MVMAQTVVQLVGRELGQHGPNVYYREFSVCINEIKRNYKLGEFYFVRKQEDQPICIAELQLIWLNIKDGKKYATAKLYFRPEDTKLGRLCEHGEDELVEADKHVPIHCEQMPFWECIPAQPFGQYAYEGVKNIEPFITKHQDEKHQQSCICGTTNGHVNKHVRAPVKILSFPAYCRYRSCLKLLATCCSPRRDVMLARGAFEIQCSQLKILFCRFKFQHADIEEFSLDESIKMPVFKGRPRKRKQNRVGFMGRLKRTKIEKGNSTGSIESKPPTLLCQAYKIVPVPKKRELETRKLQMKADSMNPYVPIKRDEEGDIKILQNDAFCQSVRLAKDVKIVLAETDAQKYEREKSMKVMKPINNDERNLSENEKTQTRNGVIRKRVDYDVAPSELVKKGKTGTILDESFFREMKNGSGGISEGIDNEKMKKILKDACKDEEKFRRDLFMFMKQRGTPIIYVPKVGYTRVDLPKLFNLVVSNGGYKQVTLNHKWKKVYDEMLLATTITSAATCMRRHYEKLLLPFEKHLRVKHKQDVVIDKTYSVTSQTNQPLVLTIKTIKQDTTAESAAATITSSANLPSGCATLSVPDQKDESMSTCKDVMSTAVPTSESSSLQTPQSALTGSIAYNGVANDKTIVSKQYTTCSSVINATPEKEKMNCATVLQDVAGAVCLSDQCKLKMVARPIVLLSTVISNSESVSEIGKISTQPTDPLPIASSSSLCINTSSQNTNAIIQNNSTHKTNLYKDSLASTTIPMSTAELVLMASSHSFTKASSAIGCHTEVSVITKARPMQHGHLATNVPPAQTCRNEVLADKSDVVKKRRGRPPKYLKNQMEGQIFNTSNQVVRHAGNTGTGLAINSNVPLIKIPNTQTNEPVNTSNTQPAEGSTSRKATKATPVKVYEYVMATNAMQAKLVKHKHGVISLPKLPSLPKVASNYSAIANDNLLLQKSSNIRTVHDIAPSGNFFNTSAVSHVTVNDQCKVSTIHPKVETIMSYPGLRLENLGPENRLLNMMNMEQKPISVLAVPYNVDLKCVGNKTDSLSNNNIVNKNDVDGDLQASKEDGDKKKGHEVKCVGPPPLIPIQKQENSDQSVITQSSLENVSKNNSENTEIIKHDRMDAKNTDDLNRISLIPDFKRMKDSFDINSLMKPFSKKIDQSLENIRKAAGASIDQEPTTMNQSNDLLTQISSRGHHISNPRDYTALIQSQMYHTLDGLKEHTANQSNGLHSDFHRIKHSDSHVPSRLSPVSKEANTSTAPATNAVKHQISSSYDELKVDVDSIENHHHTQPGMKHDTYRRNAYNFNDADARVMHETKVSDTQLLRMALHKEQQHHIYIPGTMKVHGAMNTSIGQLHDQAQHGRDECFAMYEHKSQHNTANGRQYFMSHDQRDSVSRDHPDVIHHGHLDVLPRDYHDGRRCEQYKMVHSNERVHRAGYSESNVHDSIANINDSTSPAFGRSPRNNDKIKDLESFGNRKSIYNQTSDVISTRTQSPLRNLHVDDSHCQQQSLRGNDVQRKGMHTENDLLHGEKMDVDIHQSVYHFTDHHPYRLSKSVHHSNYHHIMPSPYSVSDLSPPFEQKHTMMADHAPAQHSWYDLHRPSPSAAANNAFYWHQQVHH